MIRSDSKTTYRKVVELSLGPLQWRSLSTREEQDNDAISDAVSDFTLHSFTEQLQALIDLALREGCTAHDVNTILAQHTDGDHHGDA